MPLNRIACPECGAGLNSKAGFTPGRTVSCPKCEADFVVEEPAFEEVDAPAPAKAGPRKAVRAAAAPDDEDDDRPRKNKKRRRDDDEGEEGWSYKTSWVRFAVLGVLVVVMLVLAYLLYEKRQREKAANAAPAPADDDGIPKNPLPPPGPGAFAVPKNPGGGGKGGPPKQPNPAPAVNPFAAVLGQAPAAGTPEARQLSGELSKRLVGTWEGTAPGGAAHTVTYEADGRFTHTTAGGAGANGLWSVAGFLGTKGLKLRRPGKPTPYHVVFEGDELIHDTGTPGETVVLRKK